MSGMRIEQEIFAHYAIDEKKLLGYGFQQEKMHLVYAKDLPGTNFRITVTYDRTISGRITDLETQEDYFNFRLETARGYSAEIRQQFCDLLLDIREKCCKNQYFRTEQGRRIYDYIFETYGTIPEFLWPNIPSYAAFRRQEGKKWYAVIGSVPRYKVDPASASVQDVEVMNLKVDQDKIDALLKKPGLYPAFHMNKKCWVSVILDDTLSDTMLQAMVSESYERI